ncbi:MAG: glycine dehydrogenase (aminomethyl-transferring), partial [Sphaerospermopsis kisseleviana]
MVANPPRPQISANNSQKLSTFAERHIGPSPNDIKQMLALLELTNINDLIDQTVPKTIRYNKTLQLPAAQSEYSALAKLKQIADKNQVYRSFIGMGYHDCITPGVIQRNIL